MSLVFDGKPLADGQLAAAVATLYTVPADVRSAIVRFAHFENVGSTSEAVRLYANVSGTRRGIGRCTLEAGEQWRPLEVGEVLHLQTGDTIDGHTTNATTVDYLITGVEER